VNRIGHGRLAVGVCVPARSVAVAPPEAPVTLPAEVLAGGADGVDVELALEDLLDVPAEDLLDVPAEDWLDLPLEEWPQAANSSANATRPANGGPVLDALSERAPGRAIASLFQLTMRAGGSRLTRCPHPHALQAPPRQCAARSPHTAW
jgi:hypothetical protein